MKMDSFTQRYWSKQNLNHSMRQIHIPSIQMNEISVSPAEQNKKSHMDLHYNNMLSLIGFYIYLVFTYNELWYNIKKEYFESLLLVILKTFANII